MLEQRSRHLLRGFDRCEVTDAREVVDPWRTFEPGVEVDGERLPERRVRLAPHQPERCADLRVALEDPAQPRGTKPAAKVDSVPPVKDSVASAPADSAVAASGSPSAPATSGSATVAAPNAAIPAAETPKDRQNAAAHLDAKPKAAEPAGTSPNAKLASNQVAPPKLAPTILKPVSDSIIGRRLAQVFGAMQPKDAARVLEQMDDNDVRSILGSLSSKQQAAILGSFPTQRAATILQATPRTASSGGME